MPRRTFACIAVVLATAATTHFGFAQAPSPLGHWLTQDRDGVIEIYPCGDALCGRLVWQRQPLDADGRIKVDRNNPVAALRNRPLCGIQIMSGFTPSGADTPNEWHNGAIYSPVSGSTYHARLRLPDSATLELRGYIGIPLLGQTQTWTRDATGRPACTGP